MSRENQIEAMANTYEEARNKANETIGSMNEGEARWYAKAFYEAGYRKIHDDHARQCTCYALGCQMAEELKSEVAREIFEGIKANCVDSDGYFLYGAFMNFQLDTMKKYTEEGK